jgi:hypothetical protein
MGGQPARPVVRRPRDLPLRADIKKIGTHLRATHKQRKKPAVGKGKSRGKGPRSGCMRGEWLAAPVWPSEDVPMGMPVVTATLVRPRPQS